MRFSTVFFVSVLVFLMSASAIHAQRGGGPGGGPAEQAYKNIQVLKGSSAAEVNQTMHLMNAALGVVCEHCHVDGGGRELDDRPAKAVARQMLQMVADLNRTQFGGRQAVTCFTCHRGSTQPIAVPDMVSFTEPKPAAAPVLPTVDQILAKYVSALGGEAALRKVTSRMITGTQSIPTGPGGRTLVPVQVEEYRKAPNLYVTLYKTAMYTIAEGFDGTTAWAQGQNGRVTEQPKPDADRAKRSADFYEPLNLKQEFASLVVRGIETINGHDAYAVVGTPQGDNPETLYFDVQSGLLLRRTTYVTTPAGGSPFRRTFDDYRDSSGVKVPFAVLLDPAGPRILLWPTTTLRVTSVQDNVAIDNSRFAKPSAR
jgi:hypothetical protein